jgi:hypothetical protein
LNRRRLRNIGLMPFLRNGSQNLRRSWALFEFSQAAIPHFVERRAMSSQNRFAMSTALHTLCGKAKAARIAARLSIRMLVNRRRGRPRAWPTPTCHNTPGCRRVMAERLLSKKPNGTPVPALFTRRSMP